MINKNKVLEQVKKFIDSNNSEENLELFQNMLELLKERQNNNNNNTYNILLNKLISEQNKNEKDLLKFKTAVLQSPSAIVITDIYGTIEYVNPQFTKITGYSFEEAVGNNPRILKGDNTDPEEYKKLWDTIIHGNIWNGEFNNKKKDGSYFWEKALISPIMDDNGNIINFLAIKDDITAQKEAEFEITASQQKLKDANKTKDKFFSIIAHDLKNPFNIILGFSDLLLQNHKEYDVETRESVIKTIYEISLKTFNLLENLLAWSRSKSGNIPYNPKNLDIKLIAIDSISLFKEAAEKKNIKISLNISEDYTIYADRDMIAAVIRNLVNNAIKFTPRNGKILVSASICSDNFLEISIKDSGIGIKKEKLEILFNIDRDWSTPGTEDEAGTGLGLFLCKEFVEKNGGKIWVKSEINSGTEFIFTIPIPES
jgi:PAS domain S-box-containing protein